jgi:hypothetical protein
VCSCMWLNPLKTDRNFSKLYINIWFLSHGKQNQCLLQRSINALQVKTWVSEVSAVCCLCTYFENCALLGYSATSIGNPLPLTPEEHSSHQHCGGHLKSHTYFVGSAAPCMQV